MIDLIYRKMCPGCGGEIESSRLAKGLLCKRCLPNEDANPCEVKSDFSKVCKLKEQVKAFEEYFKKTIGFSLRELQRAWAKRFFLGHSFAMLAPTGIGKSTFGLALASFLLPKKSYLIFPTNLLVEQAYSKLQAMGYEPLIYSSSFSAKKKKEIKAKIASGDFDILITTTSFLYRNFENIPKDFEFVFVDDVDSILKSAKNIDKVLMLLGFSEDDIKEALEFIEYKRKMITSGKFSEKSWQKWQAKIQKIRAKIKARLIVSSATANPKSKRVHLFYELLGFEVGKSTVFLRNIEDIYEKPSNLGVKVIEYIKAFGKGGLLFLPGNKTKEELKRFVSFLQNQGIRAKSYEEFDKESFRSGQIEVVVGFASYKNPLARGLDMPDVIRYALFVGVPKLEFALELKNHIALYFFLLTIRNVVENSQIDEWLEFLNRIKAVPFEALYEKAKEKVQEIYEETLKLLDEDTIKKINSSDDITLEYKDGFKLIVADVTGYIQASGRTSRLYAGGLTKGLSFVLVDNQKAFVNLQKKLKWLSDIEFKPKEKVDLKAILKQIDEDRKKVKLVLEGRVDFNKELFKTNLVIVESPNKAKTIASFYGKPMLRDIGGIKVYEVAKENAMLNIVASKGHIFDLATEGGFYGVLGESHFIEIFEPLDSQREQIMKLLRELDIENSKVFIATDPDTEGEKISYDIYLNLIPYNNSIKRAEFHEVTKRAFEKALSEYRDFDENLVQAQLLRRVADRWIGFELSSYLQKKFNKKTLSAGRVQSAVLEWIVLREYEAKEILWAVKAKIEDVAVEFLFEEEKEVKAFFQKANRAKVAFNKSELKSIIQKPLSTDKMLSLASKELHFSPQKSMQLAQELFEAGFITYHRTDSIRISSAGIAVAKEYITSHFKKEYFSPRSFEQSGGAHEAIRATRPLDAKELEELLHLQNKSFITNEHIKLYDLIFRYFIASQMKEAIVKEIEATIEVENLSSKVIFFSEIIENGANLLVPIELKSLKEGEYEITKELSTRPKVPRYTYAQIITLMKTKGIGRPSTYAITLEKLLERKYIYQKGTTLFATNLGIKVYEELKNNPSMYTFINEHYTKELEMLMDKVEEGQIELDLILAELKKKIMREIHREAV